MISKNILENINSNSMLCRHVLRIVGSICSSYDPEGSSKIDKYNGRIKNMQKLVSVFYLLSNEITLI